MREDKRNNRKNNIDNTDESRKRKTRAVLRRVHAKNSIVFVLVGMIFLALAGRIFYINYYNGDKYSKAVLDHQQYTSTVLPYKRGQIIDRNGTILAYSEKVYNLILDPKIILAEDSYKNPTLNALVQCFGLKMADLENILATKPNSHYEKLLKSLPADKIEEFLKLTNRENEKYDPDIKGVWFEDSYIRKYPFSTLACDVLGFASAVNGGELGLESYYDDSLSGIDGVTYGYVDDDLNIEETTKDPVDGYNLITTIDFSVQSIIEKHIKAFNTSFGSKNTAVVVMDPTNGEVIGMASYPMFDLNAPRDLSKVFTADELAKMSNDQSNTALYSLWKNFCVSNIYEPGSTYKPFTVGAALEENVISTADTFICTGHEDIGGFRINCHLKSGHGKLTLREAIMQSCNPAMMQIAAKMGVATFSEYQLRFGLGQKTGIDIPGEETGIIIPESAMTVTDLATNSFGQNFNVNMIQMAAGFSSLINGGNYYKPHIVKRIEKADGEVVENIGATLVKQTITASTSAVLREALKATVDSGLAAKAKVTGYSIAGKTGTAQKLPRDAEKYVISFLGYAPAEDPKFVVYVLIDEPDPSAGTNGSSGPVVTLANQILTDLLPYMNVYKDTDAPRVDTSNSPVEAYEVAPLPN